MISVTSVLGGRDDAALAPRIQDLQGRGEVDIVRLGGDDALRHRVRVTSVGGRDVAISLPRDEHIYDGAVLKLDSDVALVVEVEDLRWLRITPRSKADGLLIGHQAGHLHWKVRFDGECLLVQMEAQAQEYIDRLRVHLDDGRFTVEETSQVPQA